MPGRRSLNKILTIWPDVTALLGEWKAFIERCDSWSWGAGFDVQDLDGGRLVNYIPPPSAWPAVVTTSITAAPNANTLGVGAATIRTRVGAALSNGPVVTVYSNLSTAVAVGKRITISPDGSDFFLMNADCP